jgi:hypothetical protein
MPATADLIEKARNRHKELSKIIEAAETVRPEWKQLQEFLAMAERLFPIEIGNVGQSSQAKEGRPELRQGVNGSPGTIADRAERILRGRGTLSLKDLFSAMRAAGWEATGVERNDLNNLRNTLASKKDRFENTGMNNWRLMEDSEK